MNKVWTVLDGVIDTPIFGDYRRLTETSNLNVNKGDILNAKKVFSEQDPHIRGYLVEAVVQAALKSNYGNAIREYDTLNTYDIPLCPQNDNVLKSKDPENNTKAILSFSDKYPSVYRIDGSIDRYVNSLILTVNGVSQEIPISTNIQIGSNVSILYPTINDVQDTLFTVYTLPQQPPLSVFYNRVKKYFNICNNADAVTTAGKFITFLLHI